MQKSKVLGKWLHLVCLACAPLMAGAAPTEIQVVHDGKDNGFDNKVVEFWAELLQERSGGDVVLRYDPKDDVTTEQALTDIAEGKNVVALVALPVLANYAVNQEMMSILPTEGSDTLFTAYSQALRDQGMRVVMKNYYNGAPLFLAKKPLNNLRDVAGLRIATVNDPIQQKLLDDQKATAVVLKPDEVSAALTYGTVDGAAGDLFTLYEHGWYEPAKYLSAVGATSTIRVWLGSESFLSGLSPEVQEMLASTAQDAGILSHELAEKYTDEIKQELRDGGVQMIGFDALDTTLKNGREDGVNKDLYRMPAATTMTP
ncbi:TRAP transporter substrate-binding protein DctP [Paenalcaligenes sp. Me131]|uniref:TRAP transporter substrate-binding protein DctP n=1 Tax=Paenalcaligenes sp. Me131 TaxID=3392636 RepID=UPI003D26B533